MASAATFLSVVTGLVMIGLGLYDLTNPPRVADLVSRLGYRRNFFRTLGFTKILGGLGLLLGLAFGALGLLAAFGLILYFILAVRAHSRLGDTGAETIPAAALFILSALTFICLIFS